MMLEPARPEGPWFARAGEANNASANTVAAATASLFFI
jgi:hypothetical protein